MTEICVVTYTESRLDYFRRKAEKCKKTLFWWKCQKPYKQYDAQAIHGMCSDLGWEIVYLDDVIAMLEKMEVEG